MIWRISIASRTEAKSKWLVLPTIDEVAAARSKWRSLFLVSPTYFLLQKAEKSGHRLQNQARLCQGSFARDPNVNIRINPLEVGTIFSLILDNDKKRVRFPADRDIRAGPPLPRGPSCQRTHWTTRSDVERYHQRGEGVAT